MLDNIFCAYLQNIADKMINAQRPRILHEETVLLRGNGQILLDLTVIFYEIHLNK